MSSQLYCQIFILLYLNDDVLVKAGNKYKIKK
jgi:hypothetical protein